MTSAVDEGRNPYGRPGNGGNFYDAWRKLEAIPCSICGSTKKMLTIDRPTGKVIEVRCGGKEARAETTD